MKFKSDRQRKAVMAKLNRQRSPLLYNIKSLPKNVDHLPVETSIVVPTTDKNQKKISAKEEKKRVDEVRAYLSKKFGGYTSVTAVGGFVMDSNGKKRVVKEKVIKVTAFASKEDFNKNKVAISRKTSTWGKKWGQVSMGVENEGDLFLIDTSKKR